MINLDMDKVITKQRNSSFELLRIISIYGIISMHSFGGYLQSATGFERIYGCIINSVFNMGVSLFMLISGYFGINFSIKKLIKLLVTVIVYSLANTSFTLMVNQYFSIMDLVKSVFVIFTNKYWYATVYITMFLLAPFINQFLSSLKQKEYKIVIIILFVFFVLAPTLLQEQILNDAGKGIVNMFLLYIVGRYIKIYGIGLAKIKTFILSLLTITVLSLLTVILSIDMYSSEGGVYYRYCYDNSIFIFFGSVFTFLFFKELYFESKIINKIAESVFAIYLFEGTLRQIIIYFYNHQKIKIGIVMYNCFVPIIIILCIFFIENFRRILFKKFETFISDFISKRILGNKESTY